jgi:hypothetical protein
MIGSGWNEFKFCPVASFGINGVEPLGFAATA